MTLPIALELYSVRDALANDFEGVVRKVAKMGYAGVETAGVYGKSPKDAAALFQSLGLKVAAAHVPLPIGDKKNEVLDIGAALGTKYLVLAWMPPENFKTPDAIKAACAKINEGSAVAKEHGFVVGYHNHAQEFEKVGNRLVYEYMLDYLDPTVVFEVDTYWAETAGASAADALRKLGDRAPLLHIKDGPCTPNDPMVAVGEGKMDFHKVLAAATSEWLIVELDRCATDMLTAVEKSYQYLAREGFGHGRQ
jgi:sugar phosphate isomerase/epimerase